MKKQIHIASLAALAVTLLVNGGCESKSNRASDPESKEESFAYSGDTGPGFWGELSSDNKACETGPRQSPVNIGDATVDPTLGPLELDFHPTPIKLINNGHTIEQEYEKGSTLTLDGKVFELLQFHFHTLSEHTVEGERFKMEIHAVTKNVDSGELAVIGLLYSIGEENRFLAQFVDLLPPKKGDHSPETEREINLAEALTGSASYYTYPGSLTTPPCSPIVTWFVLKQPAELSQEQFDAFRDIMGNNFRPVQDLSERVIRATDT